MSKSTNKELVEMLEARNENGKYDQIILKAKSCHYHDFKQPDDIVCGKMLAATDLGRYPELEDLRAMIINGEFDEDPDEVDEEVMRQEYQGNPAMLKFLGL